MLPISFLLLIELFISANCQWVNITLPAVRFSKHHFSEDILNASRHILPHELETLSNATYYVKKYFIDFYGYGFKSLTQTPEKVTLVLKGNNRNGGFLYLVNILHGDKSLTGPEQLFNYTYDHFKVQFDDLKIDNLIRPKPEREKYRMIIDLALTVVESMRYKAIRDTFQTALRTNKSFVAITKSMFVKYIRNWLNLTHANSYDFAQLIEHYMMHKNIDDIDFLNTTSVTIPLFSSLRQIYLDLEYGKHIKSMAQLNLNTTTTTSDPRKKSFTGNYFDFVNVK